MSRPYSTPRRITAAELAEVERRSATLPVPDNNTLSDWRCEICRSENVRWADEKLPSGVRNQIHCDNGHTGYGMPVARFTLSGR